MTHDLRVGIIGCGNISAAYARLGPMFKGFKITACADINIAAAQTRGEEFGLKALSVDDLLASNEIDLIINLTVPDVHAAITMQALEAGKHVYSEKPLALSVEDGLEMQHLSQSKGLRVGCAPDTFLGGAHQQARDLVDSGEIGEITAGTAHVMSHGMEHWHPNPDFFFLPGAGPVLDIGPYYIANLINLIGPVARVAALSSSASKTRTISSQPRAGEEIPVETPTNIHALLEFEAGATITLSASWDVWAHRHGNMEIYGTKGSLILPDPNFFGGVLEHAGREGVFSNLPRWEHPFSIENEGSNANYRTAGLADMAMAILDDREHRCSLDRTLHGVDVMTSILKSGERRAFEVIQTTCTRAAPLGPKQARDLLRES